MAASYRDLRVWQLSMELVVSVYEQTGGFPRQEIYGLTSQMRRSAVSFPATLLKARAHHPIATSLTSFVTPVARCLNLRPKS